MNHTGAKKIVVVTGASAGVGRATAIEFGRQGCTVALLARGRPGLVGARNEIAALGGTAFSYPVDVADAKQVEAAAVKIEEELGPIDIWVNGAMATIYAPVQALEPEEVRRATEVTYLGYVYGTLAALKRMRERGQGTIVQVGSALAYRAIPLQAPYCAAKFAIRGFTETLQAELRHERSPIKVTMVQLSAINTPQFDWARNHTGHKARPVPPVFQPEVAARAIVHAAFHPRRETWIGAPAAQAIVGARALPGRWIDRYLARRSYRDQLAEARLPQAGNLYAPWESDMGTHGRFDAIANAHSGEAWLSRWRGTTTVAGVALAACALRWRQLRRRGEIQE